MWLQISHLMFIYVFYETYTIIWTLFSDIS